ncbi:MAG: response regulator [Paludibacteraceae bacterium]|nr:response regulator [Paludibacteraceae bacterium]
MKRILFFDDEPFITNLLIDSLRRNFGWNESNEREITFVSSSKELFDEIKSETTYNLFVMDILAPIYQIEQASDFSKKEIEAMQDGENTGVVFAGKIRQMEKYKNVPILFLSARRQPAKMLEKTAYIEKPAFAIEVSEKMEELIKQ